MKIIICLHGEDYLNSKPSGLVSTSSPCWLQARPVMLGSAKVVIKGPSVWNAETRTQRMTSASRHAKTCASTALRVCRQHAHDTDMITSAHALRTPQSQSFANSQNLGSQKTHNISRILRIVVKQLNSKKKLLFASQIFLQSSYNLAYILDVIWLI